MAVQEVDHEQLKFLIRTHYKSLVPLYIWGATGIGKSDVVRTESREIAKGTKRKFVEWNKLTMIEKNKVVENIEDHFILMDIRLSQMDPSDLRGLPALDHNIVQWRIPFWLHVLTLDGVKANIFFDEINLAPPSIQAAAYQLILDRALGEVSIRDGVSLLSAGNRVEDRANVFDLPLPLQNRFTHATLKPPLVIQDKPNEGWTRWAVDAGVDTRIITFLQARPTFLNMGSKKNSNDRAFPTPRSWGNYCSKLIQDIPTSDLKTLHMLTAVSVGAAAASEFTGFLKFQKQVDFAGILKNPKKAKNVVELDLQYSLLALVAEWYDKYHSKENLDTIFHIAENMRDEFAILMLRMAKLRHPQAFKNAALKLKSWDEISKQYGKYLLT